MISSYQGIEPNIDDKAFVHPQATVIGEVTLGPDVTVMPQASLRGDQGPLIIGAKSNIQDGAVCHATLDVSTMELGERVTVGHNAIVHGARVGHDCLVGMGAILLDNAVIEPWTLIGAGALIPPGKRFPGGVLLVGSPAKVVREITDADKAFIEHSWKEYVRLVRQYRE